jgi:NAD(P)-dependent dehydrogenase (short-subunit alcohol dehydrogenase family)
MLVKCTALEVAFHGVRINAVAPGVTISSARTSKNSSAMQLTPQQNKEFLNHSAQDVPLMNQLNKPEEISESLLFLASDDASCMTGEIMTIDGG